MLEEIRYCAYGCFSSVVAVLCIKHDVLLTETGWMLLGSGFPFFASLGRQRGEEEEGGCGLLSYLLSPLFSFHPPAAAETQRAGRTAGLQVAPREIFSASLQEEEKKSGASQAGLGRGGEATGRET